MLRRHFSTVAQSGQTKTLALETPFAFLWQLMATVVYLTCLEREG